MMRARGLQPTSTGAVGGKETGSRMTHLIVPGGPYEQSFARLEATGWRLNLQSALARGATGKKKNKTTFTCGVCGLNWWGKPQPKPTCTPCLQAALDSHGIDIELPLMLSDAEAPDMAEFTASIDDRIHDEPPSSAAH
jgi:hypothetical protein